MYHCHFEDVEHVQMGMTGIVFVRPLQDGTPHRRVHQVRVQRRRRLDRLRPALRDPAQRDLDELPRRRPGHPGDRSPTDYDPQWFTLNGRVLPADHRCPTTIRAAGDAADRDAEPELRRRARPQPAELGADPGQPGRAGAAAAGEPRLPAARDAAAGDPDARGRPGRLAAAQRQHATRRTGPTPSTSVRARRGTCCSTRRRTRRARPSGSDGARQLQRLLLQEPGLAQAVQPRRARARRNDDRGPGVPDRRCPRRPS